MGILLFDLYIQKRKTRVASSRLSVIVTTPVLKWGLNPPDIVYMSRREGIYRA